MGSGTFEIRDQFYLNGKPFKIISGAVHYFRVVPEYWRDRLEKLRAMGCNTVETYVPWNLHEPQRGSFCFEGMLDLTRFLEIVQDLGLLAIVRPSPYICGEWEFGGLPAWLLAEDGMRLRCTYPPYMNAVKQYYHELFRILTPMQIDHRGPIILFQVENEYGAYGDEEAYLEALRDDIVQNGVTVPLVTSDGPWGDYLTNGSLPEALPTANFGSKADLQLDILRQHVGDGPLMCMEFWVGWFDAWGDEKHHTTNIAASAADLNALLQRGSVNIYMFHGGTNFGLMNGANYYKALAADVTSYDYDAPLSEDGELTQKYQAMRDVIGTYTKLPPLSFSTKIEKYAYGLQTVSERVSLFSIVDDLSYSLESPWPVSMEKVGQSYGYILYRSSLKKDTAVGKVKLIGANDRAQIYFDERHFATLLDHELEAEHEIPEAFHHSEQMDILVENMGRVNYGPKMEAQRKGINNAVLINRHGHAGWQIYRLPMNSEMAACIDFSKEYRAGLPAFYRIVFHIEQVADTFLDMTGWGKGCVLLNGFNLGRFWDRGPQTRLYVPAPLLNRGDNELIIFETEGKSMQHIHFEASPGLG
ncbi:beta-galactosidase [Sporolactobacillus shoreicorticis]|uniref:Beta-galactosidase family protein n=1 Tax=Sporolactobacillus shoreicorticis TaxID=1923877 RepID=A0ABW5S3N5_9BACL|nr:beta-galactosidase family protein [Sporolactobacillus shoreicorticis]MCO7124718.1 beta-galactosidase [Sporolactobacillus shoreicorticis]